MSVLNNFLGNVDVAQVFGIDVSSANSDAQATFGSGDIVLIDSSGEGVISGIFPDSHEYSGTTGFLTSRSIIKTVDLISEGEIEGIVSGDFKKIAFNAGTVALTVGLGSNSAGSKSL